MVFVIACAAAFAPVRWATATQTSILPIVSRPGECVYADAVAEALSSAQESIDLLLASFDLADNPLADELAAAHERGVRVRVLLDQSAWAPDITERNRPAIEWLRARGIDARFDDPEVTTHAKLVVIDRVTVVVGSTNWNRYALCEHRQADVRIDDPRLAGAFGDYYDRVWDGPSQWPDLAFDEPIEEAGEIVALPDGGGSTLYGETLLRLIRSAGRSVHASLYRVSVYPEYQDSLSNRLVEALIDAGNRGLDVRVLIDDCRFYEESATANLFSALYLSENGIPVRFDRPEQTTHAKLVIIDGRTVVLGSTHWNYYSIEQNVEANVALVGLPAVGEVYEAYFDGLWSAGRLPGE